MYSYVLDSVYVPRKLLFCSISKYPNTVTIIKYILRFTVGSTKRNFKTSLAERNYGRISADSAAETKRRNDEKKRKTRGKKGERISRYIDTNKINSIIIDV